MKTRFSKVKLSLLLALVAGAFFWIGYACAIQGSFSDVEPGSWYESAVQNLTGKNIIEGYADGTYRPDDNINRAELAVMMDRLLEHVETGEVATPPTSVTLEVPFTSQAPTGDWNLPYQEACEEASLIMVNYFLKGESLSSSVADREIIDLVEWETENGYIVDISAAETGDIAEAYYGLTSQVYYDDEASLDKIRELLAAGHPVIIPAAGHTLDNPNYSGDGPPYHMVVIIGYDESGFITHDPGTQSGGSYHYSNETIDAAIHDWNGSKSTVDSGRRALLVLTTSR